MDNVPNFQEIILIMLKFPQPAYATIMAFLQNNKNKKKQFLTYWILTFILSFLKQKFNFPPTNSLRAFLLYALFIIWLQMPLFNGSAVFYNIIAQLLRIDQITVDTDLGLGPIYEKAKENYKTLRVSLPQPSSLEDSSPSSEQTEQTDNSNTNTR